MNTYEDNAKPENFKKCSACLHTFPMDTFVSDTDKTRVFKLCILCRDIRKKYHAKHKDDHSFKEAQAERNKRNYVNRREYTRQFHARHKNDPSYREANRVYCAKYNAENRERLRENARQYYALHKDDPGFKDANNARGRNKYNTDTVCRIKSIKKKAESRGISWGDDMTDEVCRELMNSPCYLCHRYTPGILVSIDRLDSSHGYTISNCKGCCWECNNAKGTQDPATFIEQCIQRATYGQERTKRWRIVSASSYTTYINNSKRAGRKFELTEVDFEAFRKMPCVYCHRGVSQCNFATGLDRIDNSQGYTIDNVQPCCSDCNYARGTMTIDTFQTLNKLVAAHAIDNIYNDITMCLHPQMKFRKKIVKKSP